MSETMAGTVFDRLRQKQRQASTAMVEGRVAFLESLADDKVDEDQLAADLEKFGLSIEDAEAAAETVRRRRVDHQMMLDGVAAESGIPAIRSENEERRGRHQPVVEQMAREQAEGDRKLQVAADRANQGRSARMRLIDSCRSEELLERLSANRKEGVRLLAEQDKLNDAILEAERQLTGVRNHTELDLDHGYNVDGQQKSVTDWEQRVANLKADHEKNRQAGIDLNKDDERIQELMTNPAAI